jgi:hypothetical protein
VLLQAGASFYGLMQREGLAHIWAAMCSYRMLKWSHEIDCALADRRHQEVRAPAKPPSAMAMSL